MSFLNPSNQLIQIDTGSVLTYINNPSQSPIQPYANIGENQVLGQRYVGTNAGTPSAPYGAPAIFMLVQMVTTTALNQGEINAAVGPAPVYWADTTFTTVTPIASEALGGSAQFAAGYQMPNIASVPTLTLAYLLGAKFLIQVAGYLPGAWGPTTTPGLNYNIFGSAGSYSSTGQAAATAVTRLGIQISAVTNGLANVLVTADNF